MTIRACRNTIILLLLFNSIWHSSFGETLYECETNGVTSFQDKPCENAGVKNNMNKVENQEGYQAIYHKLDFLAYQGYGLSQSRNVKPSSKPSNYVKYKCGEPYFLQNVKAYKRCSAAALQELTKRKNAQASANISSYQEEIKAFCKTRWEQPPHVGMIDEDFRICSLRDRIQQEIIIDEDDLIATLYVLSGERNNRVYSIDGVITKISTSVKNRSFR